MSIEAMKLALDALGPTAPECCGCAVEWEIAITALRQAIEQAQQAEPWEKFCDSNCVWTDHHPDCKLAERLPLTDERIAKEVEAELTHYWNGEYIDTTGARDQLTAFARAIEAAHGIKGEA